MIKPTFVLEVDIDSASNRLRDRIKRNTSKYGHAIFNSPAEGLGVALLEFDELKSAIQRRKNKEVVEEALDLAAAAIWFVASYSAAEREANECGDDEIEEKK